MTGVTLVDRQADIIAADISDAAGRLLAARMYWEELADFLLTGEGEIYGLEGAGWGWA